ncbi:unnamed protein product [Tilletia controversa]|nr:unnamed protein product [Tilletia laevis]CAD6934845.1 unnamed protein product [Tilletia caries]CAD6943041.1 unnamed protein product [Tilletia controversa]CAD6946688.1 unnamed protein product [Tilletia caries]CAD6955887.1 unnamed protein product [Tilletia laevis]
MDPKEINLAGLTEQQLEALQEAKNSRLADIRASISQFKASPGNFEKVIEALREERRIAKAHIEKIVDALDNIEVDSPSASHSE